MEKKKGEKKKGKKKEEVPSTGGYRTRELRLETLMVSPPTPQRHFLGNNVQFFQFKTKQVLAATLH